MNRCAQKAKDPQQKLTNSPTILVTVVIAYWLVTCVSLVDKSQSIRWPAIRLQQIQNGSQVWTKQPGLDLVGGCFASFLLSESK